ncbi:hypothetical protein GCM10023334_067710 [Nonomuraea thailandensis]
MVTVVKPDAEDLVGVGHRRRKTQLAQRAGTALLEELDRRRQHRVPVVVTAEEDPDRQRLAVGDRETGVRDRRAELDDMLTECDTALCAAVLGMADDPHGRNAFLMRLVEARRALRRVSRSRRTGR